MEAATLARAITEIRELKADASTKSVSVNAAEEQVRLFLWLARELNQPPNADRNGPMQAVLDKREISMGDNDLVRVFYFPAGISQTDLQEQATLIRAMGEMRRLFIYHPLRLIAVRGTPEQITLAEWLIARLNSGDKRESAEMRLAAPDDVVRVVYAKPSLTPAALQTLATHARGETRIRRIFTFNAGRVIAARGTPEQVMRVGQIVEQ
ncbi:MAG: hypothetical protein HY820_12870 [Acidobacteria bacterium]|nr:hypothetical protein [Acidobacteriota bacterium]